jgi:hypothetical protein
MLTTPMRPSQAAHQPSPLSWLEQQLLFFDENIVPSCLIIKSSHGKKQAVPY